MHAEEFLMIYWRDQHVWKRWYSASKADTFARVLQNLYAHVGPQVAIMVIHHEPHYPIPATEYADDGLQRYIEDINRIKANKANWPA